MGPRLLRRIDVDTYEFTAKLQDGKVPKYAILSHTWDADTEVTFQDFEHPQHLEKAGYLKVKFCGEQAARHGLDHFWIDACCINKRSEPEQSEAINSMFRWYTNAERCYVYLSDVSVRDEDWQTSFRNSRWHTRGWTLQELIAPSSVEFFSKEGSLLGDKRSLKSLICETTGLPQSLIEGQPPNDYSVAERRRWSARRQTTLPEDRAYCLLGLFGIHMPVIYGEGEEEAFLRMQVEVEKRIRALQAASSRYQEPCIRLPPLSPYFTGRQQELQLLAQYLWDERHPHTEQARVIIAGVGGAGKTALATSYASKNEGRYSAIFFVNASDTMTLRRDFTTIAKTLGLPEAVETTSTDPQNMYSGSAAVDAVHEWLIGHPQGNWLLIVDNADDLKSVNLIDYLPNTRKGHVIITSRDTKGASAFSDKAPLQLYSMLAADAVEFFVQRAKLGNPNTDDLEQCNDIVTQLGYLALAVEHAAAYVHSADIPLRDFRDMLKQNILEGLSESSPDSLHAQTVQATVQMAFDKLKVQSVDAALLLRLMANLDNDTLSESFLLSPAAPRFAGVLPFLGSRQAYYKAKQVLLSYSMVYCNVLGGSDIIVLHPLVQTVMQQNISLEWQYKWLTRALGLVYVVVDDQKQLGHALFPHFRTISRIASRLWNNKDHSASTTDLWLTLAQITVVYRVHWQTLGLMYELDEICRATMQGLRDDTENCRLMQLVVVSCRVTTVLFINTDESPLSVLQAYLKSQMRPEAAAWLKQVEEKAAFASFNASTLEDVFLHTGPPNYMTAILAYLRHTAVICSRGNQRLSAIYLRISQLPASENWQTRFRRLTWSSQSLVRPLDRPPSASDIHARLVLSAVDRANGDIESTISVLEDALKSEDPIAQQTIPSQAVSMELARIYLGLGDDQKAADRIAQLEPLKVGQAEEAVARKYQDGYIWARKAQTLLRKKHEQHAERLRILEETYRVAQLVFGKVSLSTFHAAMLLRDHHADPCCGIESERDRYSREVERCFARLYGGAENLRRAEGLNMGRILLAQGSLEEAICSFEIFFREAERTLGPDDPVTQRARRWLDIGSSELQTEKQELAMGKVTLQRGSMIFQRSLDEMGRP